MQTDAPTLTPPPCNRRRLAWLMVGLAIVLTVYVRFRLREFPLERDEGEYAYAGQLLLEGIPPYQLAYNMKFPGTYAAYAALMAVFGQTIAGIHLGLIVVNVASIVLVFLLGRKLIDETAGWVAAVSYGVMSMSPQVMGTAAHATHFVVLPALGGVLVFLRAMETGRWQQFFGSGLLLGVSLLMKQHGILYGAFACAYLLLIGTRVRPVNVRGLWQRMGALMFGLSLPLLWVGFALWLAGVFEAFVFWTFSYAREYATMQSWSVTLENLPGTIGGIWRNNEGMWTAAALGLILLNRAEVPRRNRLFLGGFALMSFLAICPGLYFRPHYFILLLPAVALFIGVAVTTGGRLLAARKPLVCLPMVLFGVALVASIVQQRFFFFTASPLQACRAVYYLQPFPESVDVADYIRSKTGKEARIAVIGSEPQVYFYAQRHSATGYIYAYPLMEKHPYAAKMQAQMIQEIEDARPEYLVYFGTHGSWIRRDDSELMIFRWFGDYNRKYYQLEGVIDNVALDNIQRHWGADALTYKPRSGEIILVLKRKAGL